MKKSIIMIKDMNCEHCKSRIAKALDNESIDFEIILESKTVVIMGDNDKLALAKRIITQEGYTIL